MIIIKNKILPFGRYKAINLFGILFTKAELSQKDITHETIHTKQMQELLYIFFYLWYGIEFLIRWIANKFNWKQAYKSIWFEQKAYTYQDNKLYPDYRTHYNWLNKYERNIKL